MGAPKVKPSTKKAPRALRDWGPYWPAFPWGRWGAANRTGLPRACDMELSVNFAPLALVLVLSMMGAMLGCGGNVSPLNTDTDATPMDSATQTDGRALDEDAGGDVQVDGQADEGASDANADTDAKHCPSISDLGKPCTEQGVSYCVLKGVLWCNGSWHFLTTQDGGCTPCP